MREIKFRQFYDGGVHYWGYENISESKNPVFTGPVLGQRKFVESHQYTGLKDANGVEIYEGDILRCLGFDGVVGFDIDEPRFSVTPTGEGESLALIKQEMHHFKVIGNIYQNPELLK